MAVAAQELDFAEIQIASLSSAERVLSVTSKKIIAGYIKIFTCESFAGRAFGIRVGTGQNKVEISNTSVCDPHFLTIDDIIVAL